MADSNNNAVIVIKDIDDGNLRILERACSKLDKVLLPFCFLFSIIASIDRANLGFASIDLTAEIGLSPQDYGLGAGIFFLSYSLFQVPCNILFLFTGGPVLLGVIAIAWGVAAAAQAAINGRTSFLLVRLFLGVAEAGTVPGIWAYLAHMYPTSHLTLPTTYYMAGITAAQALGAPLAAGLLSLHGVAGLSGWRWLFIIEGIPSVLMGIAIFALLPRDAAHCKWLSAEERACLQETIDTQHAAQPPPAAASCKQLAGDLQESGQAAASRPTMQQIGSDFTAALRNRIQLREQQQDTSPVPTQLHTIMRRPWLFPILLAVIAASAVHASTEGGPSSYTALERGLLEHEITAELLVEEGNNYHKAVGHKNFQGTVLGYVTPWNNHGYDVAKKFRAKFTHISPVWYQLRGGAEGSDSTELSLTGGHDVDKGWIKEVRAPVDKAADCADGDEASKTCAANLDTPQAPLIVPRVLAEVQGKALMAMLQQPGDALALLVDEVEKHGFDGLVFEAWQAWTAMGLFNHADAKEAALAFVKKLAANLRDKNKILILPIPPVKPSQPQAPAAKLEDLLKLSDDVAGFNVMTYDYSYGRAGPNGPLPWQEENAQEMMGDEPDPDEEESDRAGIAPSKILLGINFFGVDFVRPEKDKKAEPKRVPILARDFLEIMNKMQPKLAWDVESSEHMFKYKYGNQRHTVYFPTPASVAARVDKASELGLGIGIWDIGQGLDSFLDLL
uniref:Chitinase domain-containing protein 1 n=1 Tax=Tetradesmus obliquus TaxID=3088 RepID=A0A383W7S9_TETOB